VPKFGRIVLCKSATCAPDNIGRTIRMRKATTRISVPCEAQTSAGMPEARRSTIRPTYQISTTSKLPTISDDTAVRANTRRNGRM
jgi:hypothetical protein